MPSIAPLRRWRQYLTVPLIPFAWPLGFASVVWQQRRALWISLPKPPVVAWWQCVRPYLTPALLALGLAGLSVAVGYGVVVYAWPALAAWRAAPTPVVAELPVWRSPDGVLVGPGLDALATTLNTSLLPLSRVLGCGMVAFGLLSGFRGRSFISYIVGGSIVSFLPSLFSFLLSVM
jgi:hypothetical protein